MLDTAAEALHRIASAGAPFLTRGDRSGTHVRELELWAEAGVDPTSQPWCVTSAASGRGNTATGPGRRDRRRLRAG